MSGFTPGPWLRSGRAIYAFNEIGENRFYASVQTGFLGKGIRTGEPELEANALLIAAAPALYEACENAAKAMQILAEVAEDVLLEGAPMLRERQAELETALKQARGEQ